MAPEALHQPDTNRKELTRAADIWSLGVILYQLLHTGRMPHDRFRPAGHTGVALKIADIRTEILYDLSSLWNSQMDFLDRSRRNWERGGDHSAGSSSRGKNQTKHFLKGVVGGAPLSSRRPRGRAGRPEKSLLERSGNWVSSKPRTYSSRDHAGDDHVAPPLIPGGPPPHRPGPGPGGPGPRGGLAKNPNRKVASQPPDPHALIAVSVARAREAVKRAAVLPPQTPNAKMPSTGREHPQKPSRTVDGTLELVFHTSLDYLLQVCQQCLGTGTGR